MSLQPEITPIDFANTPGLERYADFYATILDDVFTPEECRSLLALVTASAPWTPAALSAQDPTGQTVHKEFRNSERIIYIDEEAAKRVYERLKPLVQGEIGRIEVGGRWDGVTGKKGRKQGPSWELACVNPRLSFLRYGPGHYFKQHCDGLNELPREEGTVLKSFVTLHLYLNSCEDELLADDHHGHSPESKLSPDDPDEPLIGGATRFWTADKKHYLDVMPRAGRVLVFQQRMLIHSGEEVLQGVKYTMRSDFMFEQVD
ncbi:hypothetical protein D9613_006236 [Agrocybe pediades]|uniref:Prolyl 4-hydroxylase alpha subunit domain-containing protein n=1 Tax=Agrocybe pediades TaxID=84607 RepID=A0A8H4QU40_9AGAR|nr:hypothetical protein D9613_006236 [Agrocybe pediades]